MSLYVLMRLLESSPQRYEQGIGLLTLGRLGHAYDRLMGHVHDGDRVLDLGCGVGLLTFRAARRGARVKAIDINPQMLEIARRKAQQSGMAERISFAEMSVVDLDSEPAEHYDVVSSGLCFSELSEDEIDYVLQQVRRILKPDGLLLVVDETQPSNPVIRFVAGLFRLPLVLIAYLVTQQTSHPVARLPERLEQSGLSVVSIHHNFLSSLTEVVARKGLDQAREET